MSTETKDKLDSLSKALYSLRRDNDSKEKTQSIKESILENLGYQKNSKEFQEISDAEFNSFVIKVVMECFGKGLKSDIILMSSGLLAGYNYHRLLKLTARRNKFLEESNYLQNFPISKAAKRKTISEDDDNLPIDPDDITDFNDLGKKGKESCRSKLARKEENLFDELALFLSKRDIKMYFEKIIVIWAKIT